MMSPSLIIAYKFVIFEIASAQIVLPENRAQYKALEICKILEQVVLKKEKGATQKCQPSLLTFGWSVLPTKINHILR